MPRVSDAYRDARREEIAAAALRCLRRTGVAGTTMADIIAESGLSAGAIYSHFRNKAELAGFVASTLVGGRLRAVVEASSVAGADPLSPAELLGRLLPSLETEDVPFEVIVQLWGEATRDPAMQEVVTGIVAMMRATFGTAVEPWLRARLRRDPTPAEVERVTVATATVSQGWIARVALTGPQDPAELLGGLELAFGA